MAVGGSEEWRNPSSKDRDLLLWDVAYLDNVITQATASKTRVEKRLWCAKVIAQCVKAARPHELSELRQHQRLLPTLQYLFSQVMPTLLGAKLRQHVLSVYLHLLGGDVAFDEKVVMEVNTVEGLITALGDDAQSELRYTAVLVLRRISELPHVSSILVFDEILFDMLQDLLENYHANMRMVRHVFHLFVNLSGHPKLHYKLARSRRVVFAAIDTLLCVLELKVVKRATKRVRRVLKAYSSAHQFIHSPTIISTHAAPALEHISMALPCAMIIGNLLFFPENRAPMMGLYPDLVRALELCDSQEVSIRLWKVARCAADYLHENETLVGAQLLTHLGGSQDKHFHH